MKRFFCIMLFAALAFSPAIPSRESCPEACRGGCSGPGGRSYPAAFAAELAVCVTKKGKKYHRATCRTLKDADVQRLTRAEAESKGYTPCKVCKP